MQELLALTKEIQEVKGDVKWLVTETKRINSSMQKHITDGDKNYRPQVEANSRLRKNFYKIMGWLIPANLFLLIIVLLGVLNYIQ